VAEELGVHAFCRALERKQSAHAALLGLLRGTQRARGWSLEGPRAAAGLSFALLREIDY
jgi:hypothetical protein